MPIGDFDQRKEAHVGGTVIPGKKTKEVKSKSDPVDFTAGATNRGERIMGAYPFPHWISNKDPKIGDGRFAMKYFKILIPIIIILISFAFLPAAFAPAKFGEQKVQDFVASTMDGKSFALTDWLQGPDNKVLILTFFATWCELCDEDLKFFQRLQDQYAGQGLRVFCVFTGSPSRVKAAKKYLEGLKIELPVLMDNKRVITKLYKVAGFPCSYAIDKEGFLRIRYLGCSEDVKISFERNLKNLLTLRTNPLILSDSAS